MDNNNPNRKRQIKSCVLAIPDATKKEKIPNKIKFDYRFMFDGFKNIYMMIYHTGRMSSQTNKLKIEFAKKIRST